MSDTQTPVVPTAFEELKAWLVKKEQDALAAEHAAIADVEALLARIRAKL